MSHSRNRAGSKAAPKQQKKYGQKYTEGDLKTAVEKAWNNTQRLRTQSGGQWTRNMNSIVQSAAGQTIPFTTVRSRFQKRLSKSVKKPEKSTRGKVMRLEKRAGYDWIEFMRKRFFPPTRLELRVKVIALPPHLNATQLRMFVCFIILQR